MNKAKGLRTLREITALFDEHGVRFAPVTREIADKLAGGGELTPDDRHVLFGGMGSLNDVFITRLNGDKVDDEDAANRRLDQLRTRLWRELSH
jgi:hypothetical protein